MIVTPRRSASYFVAGTAMAGMVLGIAFAMVADRDVSKHIGRSIRLVDQLAPSTLEDCIAKLPKHEPITAREVDAASACRATLELRSHSLISPTESAAVARWLAAEDELANEASLITVYYAS